jgi:predicted  nucleic acid-binding Zn-ribbon protein
MTIKEKLQSELDAARAEVARLEQSLANLPAEIEHLAVEAWDKVRDFFKAL